MILEHPKVDVSSASDDEINESDESINTEDENVEDTQCYYKESFWPAKPDTPKGFTYKGKAKMMTYSMNKIKNTLKKGMEKQVNGTNFKIVDTKLHGGATQLIVQMISKAERGIAIAEFWGPNKRKECTILVKKSKEYDEKFVSILAKKIIQPCLDHIMSGKSLVDLLKIKKKDAVKGKNNKCSICDKVFSSSRYLKVHMTKIHTSIKKGKCEVCDYTDHNNAKLEDHIKVNHDESQQSQQLPMDTQSTLNDSKNLTLNELEIDSWEEKRVDDQLMDTEPRKEETNDGQKTEEEEIIARSNYRDEQIIKKNKVIEEREELQRMQRKNSEDTNSSMKKSSRKKKKRKRDLTENTQSESLPAHLKNIPDNIKHFAKNDDLILTIVPDGACAPRAGAAHIFEDQNEGIRFRSVINTHIADRFWDYYCHRVSFPYKREIGTGGKSVEFSSPQEYLNFLKTNPDAKFLWSDNEELLAIANLYQMNINIIKTRGPEDRNPSMYKINADAKLAVFAFLPKGKVQDMTVINTNESHYDLIVSKSSRIAQNLLTNNARVIEKPENVKEELNNLKISYNECLKYIEKLENEIKEAKKEKEAVDKDVIDAEILLRAKSHGFIREGPQFNPTPKPYCCEKCNNKFKTQDQLKKHLTQHTNNDKIKCDICSKIFETTSHLKEHMEEKHINEKQFNCYLCDRKFHLEDQLKEHRSQHSNDGDWNCDDCDHQTNSMDSLKQHLEVTHHGSKLIPNPTNLKFECNSCKRKFYNKTTLDEHKQRTHKSFKPCRNMPNCPYKDECIFNHKTINNNMFLCYECGIEEKTLADLMIHRKNKHTVSDCYKYSTNECKHTSETCWFNHKMKPENNIAKEPDMADKHEGVWEPLPDQSSQKIDEQKAQSSVFWDTPANLAPPSPTSPPVTQAMWLRMVQMLESLNKMMKQIKEANPSL